MTTTDATPTAYAAISIPSEHPCLAGHFPGRPVVPGVLLLDCIIDAAQAWLGKPLCVQSVPQVKFTAPLLPLEQAEIEMQQFQGRLKFIVRRADTIIASGVLGIATSGAALNPECISHRAAKSPSPWGEGTKRCMAQASAIALLARFECHSFINAHPLWPMASWPL